LDTLNVRDERQSGLRSPLDRKKGGHIGQTLLRDGQVRNDGVVTAAVGRVLWEGSPHCRGQLSEGLSRLGI
jgi:hypothetical protein